MPNYTTEKNTIMLIALLKQNNIKKIIISPGTTNFCLVASVENDPFFELYSAADERSAAYLACGLAAESGEPVCLSCTGATASRNYIPGLTEAFYRKLPILAITSTLHTGRIGQNFPQQLDRSEQLNDMVKLSVQIPTIHSEDDEWSCNVKLNEAIQELRHHGGGPVHINLVTTVNRDFSITKLPTVRTIKRIEYFDSIPKIQHKNIAIFVGSHKPWTSEETDAIDSFCNVYNAVVLCDHTSNYHGKYRIYPSIITEQEHYKPECTDVDLLIDMGEVSGAYITLSPKEVWRISPDGIIRDKYKKLKYIFEMRETDFFKRYVHLAERNGEYCSSDSYYQLWKKEYNFVLGNVQELPFSNEWIAYKTAEKLPQNSTLHLGILNSLRTWNHYMIDPSINTSCNTGGFGIDGCVSTLIGASFNDKFRIYFGIVGDLAFFYDMNSIGNRHVDRNLRLIVVNNGKGTEFRQYFHPASALGDEADRFIAAAGHYGNKSSNLVKHYAQDLGFEYLSASDKDEYLANLEHFTSAEMQNKPILYEVFTDSANESLAEKLIRNAATTEKQLKIEEAKQHIKEILPNEAYETIKKIIRQ